MWQDFARCKGVDTNLFYPRGIKKSRRHVAQIKELYCDRCVVRPACFRDAVENEDVYGIWGGHHFLEDNPAKA